MNDKVQLFIKIILLIAIIIILKEWDDFKLGLLGGAQ